MALRVSGWSVRRKLVALLVAASLLPLAVSAVLDIRASRSRLRASVADLLTAHVDQLQLQIDAFHQGYLLSAIDNAVLVETLERRVAARTAALEAANQELEAFSFSVSHDLRAPLRTIGGFSDILLADYAGQLAPDAGRYLQRIRAATHRMSGLIDDLLNLARITRVQLRWAPIDLAVIAAPIIAELARRDPGRITQIHVVPGLTGHGDGKLMTIALENLLGNAWKFTAKQSAAEIWLGSEDRDGHRAFFVRDSGAGFDMKYADKLFLPFQRLHTTDDFEGVGVGLATVQRIISHHGGRIWAESRVGAGATFFFFLGTPA
jgi:light-regulated signal transduction histidine kinase (bacteriophytochrome)